MATGKLYSRTRRKYSGAIIRGTIFSILFFCGKIFAQDEYVTNTFQTGQLINSQTTEVCAKGGSEFIIRHRFGMFGPDSSAYQQFLGLDLPANIRLGFAIPVTERLCIGIGRTKNNKTIDGEIKYLLLRQTEDNRIPVSVAVYTNAALITDKFPRLPANAFYSDSTTAFTYRFPHRLSYFSEIIIARKFSEKLSFQFSPSFTYLNLVGPGKNNYSVGLTIGGRIKTGMTSSFLFEYSYRFNNRPAFDAYPLSIAWEFGTAGHIFQLVLSSTNEIVQQDIQSKDSFNYMKGKFALGFNIKRIMWKKSKM